MEFYPATLKYQLNFYKSFDLILQFLISLNSYLQMVFKFTIHLGFDQTISHW